MRTAERDEYQYGTLVNGLPTCTFAPKSYHRIITNIVVGNGTTSVVNCYRGILGSTPVASNLLGSNNTLHGEIKIPAGQAFYVQWSAIGTSAAQAFARVSWDRDNNPFEVDAGRNTGQEWATDPVTSLTLPNTAGPNEAAIVIGADLPTCMQASYSSAIFWRPELTLAPQRTPYFFEAQRKSLVAGSQAVDHGWLIYDGTNCGYVVYRRVFGGNASGNPTGPLLIADVWSTALESVGGVTVTSSQVQWRETDVFLFNTGNLFLYNDRAYAGNKNLWYVTGGATHTTTSAAFVTMNAGVASVTFNKRRPESALDVDMHCTLFTTGAAAGAEIGVDIAGTSLAVARMPEANLMLNEHTQISGIRKVFGGLAAGVYTVNVVWRRISGGGTVTFNFDDLLSMTVKEVDPS